MSRHGFDAFADEDTQNQRDLLSQLIQTSVLESPPRSHRQPREFHMPAFITGDVDLWRIGKRILLILALFLVASAILVGTIKGIVSSASGKTPSTPRQPAQVVSLAANTRAMPAPTVTVTHVESAAPVTITTPGPTKTVTITASASNTLSASCSLAIELEADQSKLFDQFEKAYGDTTPIINNAVNAIIMNDVKRVNAAAGQLALSQRDWSVAEGRLATNQVALDKATAQCKTEGK